MTYLQEEPIWRSDAHPAQVAVMAHDLERLRRPRRGRRGHDGASAVDTPELPAGHPEVERRLVDPPQLNTIKD
jgi:hypothetical protein